MDGLRSRFNNRKTPSWVNLGLVVMVNLESEKK